MTPLILLAALAAQSDKLPPANPLPPPGTDEAAVIRPIEAMFAGLAARDADAILAEVRPEGGATVAVERADGTHAIKHLSWADYAAGIKPGPERYEERLRDVAIDMDGDIAMVWAPYVFLVDGKVQHCGVDHFDLVRENARWKVLNVTWSQRTTGCPAE
jgi:hypothetical protein